MTNKEWASFDWLQHKIIHAVYDVRLWFHDGLINYACEHNLWRTAEERVQEQQPQ